MSFLLRRESFFRVVLIVYFTYHILTPYYLHYFFSVSFRSHLPGAVRIGFVDHHAVRYACCGCFSMLVLMERATTPAIKTGGLGTSARLSHDIRRVLVATRHLQLSTN